MFVQGTGKIEDEEPYVMILTLRVTMDEIRWIGFAFICVFILLLLIFYFPSR